MEKNLIDDPSVALLDEIHDQELVVSGAGGAGADSLVTSIVDCISAYTVTSYVLGNKGGVCTATVECQNNCRH